MTSDPEFVQTCLRDALTAIQLHPWPHVPNPPEFSKRASVALILRVRPSYADAASTAGERRKGLQSPAQSLSSFFDLKWVQDGEPEALFIKRTGRVGDRWSGHTALPGGGRDSIDKCDRATAVRETMEEVGLDLTAEDSIYIGNLPERVITTTWGQKGLMVLCPFMFLLTSPQPPAMILQPTEVASAHWVPVRALLSPSLRTYEYVDVASRLTTRSTFIINFLLRCVLGKMVFSAIHLTPSESIFAYSSSDFADSSHHGPITSLRPRAPPPLLLWGITLGIVTDLIDELPPYNAMDLWDYPTFTPPDLKFLVYISTLGIRRENSRILKKGSERTVLTATAVSEAEPRVMDPDGVQTSRLDMDSDSRSSEILRSMLARYFDRVNIAIGAFLLLRGAAAAGVGYIILRFLRHRKT